ncbi:hypothetical protein ACKKBF_B33650 [Auxenochlorella protothecoides x Auxenochlorella symbiontica]
MTTLCMRPGKGPHRWTHGGSSVVGPPACRPSTGGLPTLRSLRTRLTSSHGLASVSGPQVLAQPDVAGPPHPAPQPAVAHASIASDVACDQPQQRGHAMAQHLPTPQVPEPALPRPPRKAWNKGRPMDPGTRQLLSQGAAQRWKDPEYRAAVSSKLKGKPAWNKGREMSAACRAKMSAARTGRVVGARTRARMAASQTARAPSTYAACTGKHLAGVPKSAEHRTAIAAGQARRHATARALRAYRAELALAGSGSGRLPAPPAPLAGPGAGGAVRAAPPATKQGVLQSFKAELHHFRRLQEALRPWVSDFEARAGRKPTMQDVQAAGVPWLLERYRHYILLRQRLFHGAGSVRGSLDGGVVAGGPGGAPVPQQNPKAKATATDRLAAALEYRSRQAAAAGGLPGAGGAAGQAVGGRDEAAAAAEGPGPAPPAGLERAQGLGPGASTRVRSAMLAAMEYKAKREQGKA